MTKTTPELYISLVFGIINFFFFLLYIYISSLFLDAFTFVSTCKLDVYDGRGTLMLYIAQTYMCFCGHLFDLGGQTFLKIIYIIIGVVFAGFVFFYRFLITRHTSLVGTYFELSNLTCFPLILLIHQFEISGSIFYGLFVIFHIIFIISINIINNFKNKRAVAMAAAILQNTENKDFSQVISDTFQTSIRCLVICDPNPALFDRLLQIHHQSKLKASLVLEAVRFLSVFPERRQEMIELLQRLNSKVDYSRFTILLYRSALISLEENCPQHEFSFLTNLKQYFLVHQSLFWVQRSKRSYFKALKEALSTSYCYFELNSELMYLLNRYPFDPHIYIQLGEFFLIGRGDYDTYHQLTEISNVIHSNKSIINDPLLHPMSIYTPRIMQYRKIERKKNSSSLGLDGTINASGTSSDSALTVQTSGASKSGTEDSSTSSVKVATLLTTSKRKIPLFPFFHTILALVFLLAFFIFEKPYESHTSIESESIAAILQSEVEHVISITADVIISLGLSQNGLKSSRHFNQLADDITIRNVLNLRYYQNDTITHTVSLSDDNSKTFHQRMKKSSVNHQKKTISSFFDLTSDFDATTPCIENVHTIFTGAYTVLDEWQQLSYMSQALTEELSHLFYSALTNDNDSCDLIKHFDDQIEMITLDELLLLQDSILNINDRIDELNEHIKKRYYIYHFVWASFFFTIAFVLIWTIVWIIQVNLVFRKNKIAVQFLSSRERLSLLILEKPEKSWQLLSDFVNEKGKVKLIQISPNQINPFTRRSSKSSNKRIRSHVGNESKSNVDSEREISMQEIANLSNNNTDTNFNSSNLDLTAHQATSSTLYLPIPKDGSSNPEPSIQKDGSSNPEPSKHKDGQSTPRPLQKVLSSNHIKLTEQLSSSTLINANSPDHVSNINKSSIMLRPTQGRTSITFVGYPTQLFKPTVSFGNQNITKRARMSFSAPQSENDDNDEATANKKGTNNDELSQMNKSTQSFSKRLLRTTTTTTGTGTGTDDNEQDFENDPLDTILTETMQRTKIYWISLFLLLISPWFMVILLLAISIIPIQKRSHNEINAVSVLLNLGNQINSFFQITKLTYFGLLHADSINSTTSKEIRNEIQACNDYILSFNSSLILQVYNREQCFMLQGVSCTSASKIVSRIITDLFPIDSLPSEEVKNQVIYFYIPACLFVSKQLLTEIFYDGLIALSNIKHSADYCFIIAFVLASCVSVFAAFVNQNHIVHGFNSLFHYPESLVQEKSQENKFTSLLDDQSKSAEKEDSKSTPKQEKTVDNYKFPSLILIVAYVAETDEIYSISDNAQSILQKAPQDFISQKFQETFSLIENTDDVEMRGYLMPDKKRKKQFRSYTENLGQIIKCIMIEEKSNTAFQKQTTPTAQPKVENIANKLSFFVPSSFSKKFGDENILSYSYTDSILLFIRVKTNIAYAVLDKFFVSINSQVMNYSSIDILKVDGSIITLSTIPETPTIIPFLFIRDVFNDCKNFSKGKAEMFALDSILVVKSNSTNMEMKEVLEPYLDLSIPHYDTMMKMIYSSKSNECCITDELIKQFPGLKGELVNDENQMLNINFYSVPLPDIYMYFSTNV